MSVTLTQKELYDRVWKEPVDTLAKYYGLSNVGLGKACRRHAIPVPPRGYWARKAAGQRPRRPPLPPAKDGDESVTLWGSERSDAPSDEQDRAVHPLPLRLFVFGEARRAALRRIGARRARLAPGPGRSARRRGLGSCRPLLHAGHHEETTREQAKVSMWQRPATGPLSQSKGKRPTETRRPCGSCL